MGFFAEAGPLKIFVSTKVSVKETFLFFFFFRSATFFFSADARWLAIRRLYTDIRERCACFDTLWLSTYRRFLVCSKTRRAT